MDAHDTVVMLRAYRREMAAEVRAWRHFVAGVLAGIAALSLVFVLVALWSPR